MGMFTVYRGTLWEKGVAKETGAIIKKGSSADLRYNSNFIVQASLEAGNPRIGIGISYRLHGEFQEYETGDRWKADTSRLRFSFLKENCG